MTTQTAQAFLPPAGTWDIDPVHSNVEFVVRHMLTRMRGRFIEYQGAIRLDDDPGRSSVEVRIAASSIATGVDERDEHLRGPDFLDVATHPEITFRSTAIRRLVDDRYEVDGELTIRGVTRQVTLEVDYLGWTKDPWGGQRASFSARTEINRNEFGAKWNAVLETGGFVVGKTVRIELEIEAVLQV